MLSFAWDDRKAAANLAKHGVGFTEATEAFHDPYGVELIDDRFDYGEDRFIIIAMARNRCLTVAYAESNDAVRLISARPSTRTEQDAYFKAQG
ncbi:hypothetical protein GJW-30_1_03448 [Variibacter gotjawalensis]|uniref:BrnT family toxin n=1 Tax=Variibacter gotjawalensis TaxID=1333996 RepID=A0A0S3PYB6_9BRAD|nr:BrnT family toxin [Variibacter gotjawalensis]NIK46734.1 hypothetical protein [Variibacter gotjawalensis]RZS48638.1 hypothetical protein EV661_1053 [Variibacter gotjawalensis]BAT60898.1 hypothetical protein GJW-30_1_03448 [Variibacter gotjawalensis]